MKKYEFTMHSGNVTICAILTNPNFENGIVRATKVGEPAGFTTEEGRFAYQKCEPKEFIAGGGPYSLEEYFGEFEF